MSPRADSGMNSRDTLLGLLNTATSASVLARTKKDESLGNPVTGALATPISILFKLLSGENIAIASNQSFDWEQATINTYINQPERFRNYWRIINNFANSISHDNDIPTEYVFDIGDENCSTTIIDDVLDDREDERTLTRKFQQRICTFPLDLEITSLEQPSVEYDRLDEPIWIGVGPINYNAITYPQLQDEFINLINAIQLISNTVVSSIDYDATFRYQEQILHFTYSNMTQHPLSPVSFTSASQSLDDGEASPYFFIFNPTEEDLEITVFVSLKVTPLGSPGVNHVISRQIKVGSDEVFKSTGGGYHWSEVDALGGTFSDTKIVTIPPGEFRNISTTIIFQTSSSLTWNHIDDQPPDNILLSTLCNLELTMDIGGASDIIQFTPTISL